MALKGSYDFKGLTISDAYVKIISVNYSTVETTTEQVKDAAVYNPDGSLKTEQTFEKVAKKTHYADYSAKIWKDKAVRDAAGKYNEHLTSVNGQFQMSLVASAKNPLIQAYTAMKAEDKWKDYTDV